jgi:hypothetical protein
MPPKGSKISKQPRTTGGKTVTKNPTITKKRPDRPNARAGVREATQRLLPKSRSLPTSPRRTSAVISSATSSARSNSPPDVVVPNPNDLQLELNAMKLTQQALINALDEMKERFESLETTIMATPEVALKNKTLTGMTPAEAIKCYMPWVDASTLANVVSLTLDVAHLIKLIPTKQRPKGQANAGLTSGLHIDGKTGKTSLINESNVQHENQFPDYPALIHALSVYSVIRDLYDMDNLGFGCAITLYIRQLAIWTKHHNWPDIICYVVAHFEKYQASQNPRTWIDVDLQLFAEHLTKDTIDVGTSSKHAAKPQKYIPICRNWNKEKGCTWKACLNQHVCQYCHSPDHTGPLCSHKPKSD